MFGSGDQINLARDKGKFVHWPSALPKGIFWHSVWRHIWHTLLFAPRVVIAALLFRFRLVEVVKSNRQSHSSKIDIVVRYLGRVQSRRATQREKMGKK